MRTPKEFSPISPNEGFKNHEEKKVPSKPSQPQSKDFGKLSQNQPVKQKTFDKSKMGKGFDKLTEDKDLKSKKFDDVIEDENQEEVSDMLGAASFDEPPPSSIFKIASSTSKPPEKTKQPTYRPMDRYVSSSRPDANRQPEGTKSRVQDKPKVQEKQKSSQTEKIRAGDKSLEPSEEITEGMEEKGIRGAQEEKKVLPEKFEGVRESEPRIGRPAFESETGKSKSSKTEGVSGGASQQVRTDFVPPPPVDMSANTQFTAAAQETSRANPAAVIQQLTDQIITVTRSGQLDTQVTLKNIPGFEGATITVSESATAPGQINVTFGNLKPDAENLVRDNVGSLRDQLRANQNIVLQQVIITHQAESPIPTETPFAERGREREGGEGGAGGGGAGGGEAGGQEGQQDRR